VRSKAQLASGWHIVDLVAMPPQTCS